MFTFAFWKAATERAIKSGAQFVGLTIGGGIAAGVSGNEVINAFLLDYPTLGGVFLGGALASYVTSLISAPISGGSPSITGSEHIPS
ncbi:hypothetical protein [Cryobacterium sp. BB736]|uniref:hypothetical protein n=1 Tax=Cryobacterium sp. BB736 TaxID=2746963 RepID=UPI0018763398|nr:hypothetical protein [Cryobacterium sp. BB736]